MTKSNLKALNAYFRAKSLTYEWTKESSISLKSMKLLKVFWEKKIGLYLQIFKN
jgi:hypothetical protein